MANSSPSFTFLRNLRECQRNLTFPCQGSSRKSGATIPGRVKVGGHGTLRMGDVSFPTNYMTVGSSGRAGHSFIRKEGWVDGTDFGETKRVDVREGGWLILDRSDLRPSDPCDEGNCE